MNFPRTLMNPWFELVRGDLKLEKALDHLERIIREEGLRSFGVPRELEWTGEIWSVKSS